MLVPVWPAPGGSRERVVGPHERADNMLALLLTQPEFERWQAAALLDMVGEVAASATALHSLERHRSRGCTQLPCHSSQFRQLAAEAHLELQSWRLRRRQLTRGSRAVAACGGSCGLCIH